MQFLNGTVYSKALAIFLAAALGLLGAVVALSQFVILRELAGSEQREMRAMLQRFSQVMVREARPLETFVNEWARTPSKQPEVDALTVSPEGLRRLNLDFAAIFNANGKPIRIVGNPDVAGLLAGDPSFFEGIGGQLSGGNRTEFFVLGDNLCLVAIHDFVDGERKETAAVGKLFSRDSWGFFEGLFSAVVRFHLFKPADFEAPKKQFFVDLLASQQGVVDASQEDQIIGYALIKGFEKKPLGYISISQPRPLRQEGLRAIQVFLTGICLAGGALVLVVWFLLDRTILARIKDLTRKLDEEKRSGRLPVKLNFQGEDELGALAGSIENLAVLLESTQSLHRAVLEDQTESICRFDGEFRLSFANAIFLRLFKIEDSSLAMCHLSEFLPELSWRDLRDYFDKLSPEKPIVNYTHEIRFGESSSSLWFRSTLRRNFDRQGASIGGQWVLAEITAQVGAQKKMVESERRFRRLFESASDGLLLIEADTLLVSDINPSLCRMLMVAGSEVLGRRLDQMNIFAPCVEVVKDFHRRGIGRENSLRRECRLRRRDDTSLFVELRCGGYDAGGIQFVQLSFSNVSERVLGEQELRRLSAKLLRMQDEERRRIARELHDSTAQNLSALEMNMSLLEPLVAGSDPRAARIVAETRQIADECSRELRNISYLLHPPLIDEVGLAFAIRWFTDGFSKRTGIQTEVTISEGFPRLGTELEMPLFRIVQEATTNIYRHSGADRAWIKLEHNDRIVTMEIRDNGQGFREGAVIMTSEEKELGTGVGLSGMKERLANVGGKLTIESSPLGATLSISLALGAEEVPQE